MLTLPEELLLLALDDKIGTDTLHAYLDRALIAAALLDLVRHGRIVRKSPSSYHLRSTLPIGHAYLDHVLKTMSIQDHAYSLHSFSTLALVYLNRATALSPIVYAAPPNQRLLAAQDLLAHEQIIARETRFLFVRNVTLPQGNRSTGEVELREQLQKAFGEGFLPADERFRALLLLIYSTGLVENIWAPEKRDAADWRIAQVLRLTMESQSIFADAHRYIVNGIGEEDLGPFNTLAPMSSRGSSVVNHR